MIVTNCRSVCFSLCRVAFIVECLFGLAGGDRWAAFGRCGKRAFRTRSVRPGTRQRRRGGWVPRRFARPTLSVDIRANWPLIRDDYANSVTQGLGRVTCACQFGELRVCASDSSDVLGGRRATAAAQHHDLLFNWPASGRLLTTPPGLPPTKRLEMFLMACSG